MPNINKNIIKQAGAAVANATNKAAGLSASTPEPGSIISAIQLVNGGRTIGPDALAHFTESVRNKLLSLLVSLEPIQDLNGYSHPWPGGGGVNKYPNSQISGTINDITIVQNGENYSLSGTASAYSQFISSETFSLPAGTYTLKEFNWASGIYVQLRSSDGQTNYANTAGSESNTFTLASDTTLKARIVVNANVATNRTIQIEIVSGSTAPSTFSPYSNICPISGRTGANVYVSPTPNVADATTYAADWTTPAGTVYAGCADIVTGDIKAAPYYASYNGETLVGPWVSSLDEYDPEGTPTTGAQVVDLGGAMTEYQITGQDIITLVGDNYIWSDSGDVTITE